VLWMSVTDPVCGTNCVSNDNLRPFSSWSSTVTSVASTLSVFHFSVNVIPTNTEDCRYCCCCHKVLLTMPTWRTSLRVDVTVKHFILFEGHLWKNVHQLSNGLQLIWQSTKSIMLVVLVLRASLTLELYYTSTMNKIRIYQHIYLHMKY